MRSDGGFLQRGGDSDFIRKRRLDNKDAEAGVGVDGVDRVARDGEFRYLLGKLDEGLKPHGFTENGDRFSRPQVVIIRIFRRQDIQPIAIGGATPAETFD